MPLCPRCETDNPDTSKFCSECGAPLAPPAAQRKLVTVLFCDVSGSTRMGEGLDPEAVRTVMTKYFDVARAAIERHGGVVEKFIGDAVMAVFGVPVIREDDALRAVRAAREIRDAVELDVRIGVNTGTVVTGGGDSTFVTGDAVNTAARLEQSAAPGEILLGAETYQLVRTAVEAELKPPLTVKGKAEPLTTYSLGGIVAERRRRGAAMIGREQELATLRGAYEEAVAQRACHLVTVVGPPGIGKSRLVQEFLAGVRQARVLRARCPSFGEGITYWPIIEVLEQLRPLPADASIQQPLAALLGDARARTSPPETAWAVRRTLELAAEEEPTIVVFDDIHWGEPTFLDLVEHVAALARAPILLICLARPELADTRPDWGRAAICASAVTLGPLGAEETAGLVEKLLGSHDDELAAKIGVVADGNPLFVEEMVELARETQGEVAIPVTINALLAARIDSLLPAERAVLECASVEGQVFHPAALAMLAPDEPIREALAGLARKEFIRHNSAPSEAEGTYSFHHLLIRDTAYAAVPKYRRINLHERYADWLDARGGELVNLDEIAGYHLEQAARYSVEVGTPDPAIAARAAARLVSAARRADGIGDAGATVNLGNRATALLPSDSREAESLLPLLAKALYDSGRLDQADETLQKASNARSAAVAARAAVLRTRMAHSSSTSYSESLAELDRAVAVLDADGDDAALAEAHHARSTILFFAGRTNDAKVAAKRAVEYARRAENLHLEVLAAEAFGAAIAWSDTPWAEVDRYTRSKLADTRLGPRAHARALRGIALGLWARERFAEARRVFADAHSRLEALGLRLHAAAHPTAVAHMEWAAGDIEAMEYNARDSWVRLGELGEAGYRATAGVMLAEALVRLGHTREAETILSEAEQLASPDDYATAHAALAVRALLAASAGSHEEAIDLAEQSLSVVNRTDATEHQIAAQIRAAEVFVAAGRNNEAGALIAQATERANRKGNTALAARARRVLQPLMQAGASSSGKAVRPPES